MKKLNYLVAEKRYYHSRINFSIAVIFGIINCFIWVFNKFAKSTE